MLRGHWGHGQWKTNSSVSPGLEHDPWNTSKLTYHVSLALTRVSALGSRMQVGLHFLMGWGEV